jgi:hypothetical protein
MESLPTSSVTLAHIRGIHNRAAQKNKKRNDAA